jgi:hypothetical protein
MTQHFYRNGLYHWEKKDTKLEEQKCMIRKSETFAARNEQGICLIEVLYTTNLFHEIIEKGYLLKMGS